MAEEPKVVSHSDLLLAIGRVEGKLDGLSQLATTQERHDERLKSLERSRSWIMGAVAAFLALAGAVGIKLA